MKTILRAIFLTILFLAAAGPAFAQDAEYRVHPRRNFGYGAGSNVRGSFTNRISGPEENIASVTYFIDGQEMGTVSEPPFHLSYNTNEYATGWHNLSAVVTTKDSRQVTTPDVALNFLSAEQEGVSMRGIFIPILVGIVLATLIGFGVQALSMRQGGRMAPGAPRQYGFRGGTICPRCSRAYPIHLWALNLGPWKLDRCDFCGKVAFVSRKPPEMLRIAEEAERAALHTSETSLPGAEGARSEEDRLKKLLDESRYQE
jgi:hypothetical protein